MASIFFNITLYDCNGQRLAQWNYDSMYPVTPPTFTYPNENSAVPYVIEFRDKMVWKELLDVGDLNAAIRRKTQEHLDRRMT
jgi:hypothetical protein